MSTTASARTYASRATERLRGLLDGAEGDRVRSDEIERRLRLPAHDESPPAAAPPAAGGRVDLTGGRVRAGSAGRALRLLSPRLVIALVALLAALAAASVSDAIRLDQLPNPFRTVS